MGWKDRRKEHGLGTSIQTAKITFRNLQTASFTLHNIYIWAKNILAQHGVNR